MNKQEAHLQTIAECYPDLPLQNARYHNKAGQYNDILIINNEFIFRFPKYPVGVQNIQNEVRILRRIQGCTTLPIPNPVYTNLEEQRLGKVFMGYRMMPGEPLWRERLQAIDDEEILSRLAQQLARFLKELHRISLERLGTDLPVHDSLADMSQLYAEIRTHLFGFMRPDARQEVADHFEAYLNKSHFHTYPLCLQHGDFGGSNILYSPESQMVSGIIDFGFAGLGDPARDIAAASTFGESFLARFYTTYPEAESMLERARLYRGTFALFEALYGLKNDDEEAFKAGMAAYI